MPNFEIRYTFGCHKCGEPNNNTIIIAAADSVTAHDLAFASTVCGKCSEHLSELHPFNTMIKEVS